VNKNIQEFVEGEANMPDKLAFYCECSDPECIERIELTTDDYARSHKEDRHFITKVGHEFTQIEKVLKKYSHYQVVEKNFTPPDPESIDMALRAIEV
jgi:thymidylate kinase